MSAGDLERAEGILHSAWLSLPDDHRELLEAIGASQWQVVDEPLGGAVNRFLRSVGRQPIDRASRARLDRAIGIWVAPLGIVLADVGHETLNSLDATTRDALIAWSTWHEWGHALGLERCSQEDVAAGTRLLEVAPPGVRETIRRGGYPRSRYTHELVAEIYALLVARRSRGRHGRPQWMDSEIYELMGRAIGWTE